MIKLVYDGNLGNNLFQYAFARILAERLGMQLQAEPIPGFPRTADPVEGSVCEGEPLVLRGQQPDLTAIERNPGRPLLVTGYFQRAEYYVPYHAAIRQWFAMDYECGAQPESEDLVVGVRRGRDYIPRHGLPLSYYKEAIGSIPHRKLYLCSDSPADPFVQFLAREYSGEIRQPGALDNLQFISRFNRMVISNSTFLWWAAFLSEAETVAYPRPANGFWSSSDPLSRGIALEVDDPRYHYVACEPYRSEFVGEICRVSFEHAVEGCKRLVRPLLWFRQPHQPSGPHRFTADDETSAENGRG